MRFDHDLLHLTLPKCHGRSAMWLCPACLLVAVLHVAMLLGTMVPTVAAGGGRRTRDRGTARGRTRAASIEPVTCTDPDTGQQKNSSDLNSFLWTVSHNPPSYLFGTIHVPYTSVWQFIPENSKNAFYRSEFVVFELDLMDPFTISALNSCQLLPNGQYLADVIPPELYERLKQHLEYVRVSMPSWMTSDQKGRGLYADYLFNAITGNWERKRPVYVMLMINALTESDIQSRGTPVLDLFLAQEAYKLNKRIAAVEEVHEHCVPLNGMDASQVLFALNHTLWMQEDLRRGNNPHPTPSATDLIGHYNCGNLDEVLFSLDSGQVPDLLSMALAPNEVSAAQEIDSYFREELIHKRNERMAERIDALMSEHPHKSFFFAFGAGHFMGNNSVIKKLQRRGLDIKHTPADQPVSSPGGKRRRKKPIVSTSDHSLPQLVINNNLEYLDPFFNQRRNRQRHDRGRKRGRSRKDPDSTPTTFTLKTPEFNDLWVKIDAVDVTGFGASGFLRQESSTRPAHHPPSQSSSAFVTSCRPLILTVLSLLLFTRPW